jgi:hypothetical protein
MSRPIATAERQPTGVYRARTIKRRRRRTKAQVAQLDRQIIAALENDHPQSVRHIFYLMTDPRLPESVPKTDKGKNNGYRAVQDRSVKLRRSGRIPYGWITDATRRGYFTYTYSDASEFLRSVKGLFRANLWEQTNYKCEVWVESRSIAGIIEDDCRELAVSLYPAGGFSSITLAYEAAEALNETDDGREVVIFYIGDYDPAGVLIDVAIERELRRHLKPEIVLTFERIGITAEQIEQYDLPTKPRKDDDKRSAHVVETVEAEAMPAHVMREMLRDRIEQMLPPRALQVARAAEESGRDAIDLVARYIEREGSNGGAR